MVMSDVDLREFRGEAEELLKAAESSLRALDRGEVLLPHYNVLFRSFHSLKGAGGILGLNDLRDLMIEMEAALILTKHEHQLDEAQLKTFTNGVARARAVIGVAAADRAARPVETNVLVPEGRVLVIDDEPELVELISHILIASNLEVLGTSEPEKVLELIESFRPDAILTDISMPKLNGMQILELVRKSHPDLPVVFISGHVDKDSLLHAIELGVYAVIEKPFDLIRIVEIGRNATDRHKLVKLLSRSINFLKYNFVDLDGALAAQGRDDVRHAIAFEIETLVQSRRALR